MKKLTRNVWKLLAASRAIGSTTLSWVSMMLPLVPKTGDAEVRLEIGIYRVKKICKLIRLTSTSLLISTRKGMASLMMTVRVKGWPPVLAIYSQDH
jgi:hypothetical protein